MRLELPDINPIEAREAMERAKSIFAKYKVSPKDQDLLYNAIMTMGVASIVSNRTSELLRQLGIKTEDRS